MPFHLYAAEPGIEIKELTRKVDFIPKKEILDKELHVEFFLQGGYTGWFKVGWTDKDTGKWIEYTSGNITVGFYYRRTIPKGTDKSTIRVEGYTNTGLLWDKHRTIFYHTLGERTVHKYPTHTYRLKENCTSR